MKTCPYCGAEYPDDAVRCAIDDTPFEKPVEVPPAESPRQEYDIAPLSEADKKLDWVTIVKCAKLVEADLIANRLRAAGIEVFLPDESLMQIVAWNFNTFGYVRVQVSPKDYEAARDLLGAMRRTT